MHSGNTPKLGVLGFYFIVIRTFNMRCALKCLSVQHGIVNYRYHIAQQISRAYRA